MTFLPVSLGMAIVMLFSALFRRVMGVFALVPSVEWGSNVAPEDLAVGNSIAGAVMVVSLSVVAWCSWKLYRMRDEVEPADESFSVEEHVETPITRRSGSEDER